MSLQNHIIQKIIVDLNIDAERDDAYKIQNKTSKILKSFLKTELENLFNSFCDEEEIIKIDKLTIDLGKIKSTNFEKKFFEKILYEIENELNKIKSSEYLQNNLRITQTSKSISEAINFFIVNGYYPWWFDTKNNFDFNSIIKDYIKLYETNFIILIENLFFKYKNENAIKRLLNQTNTETKKLIITSFIPDFFSKIELKYPDNNLLYRIIIPKLLKLKKSKTNKIEKKNYKIFDDFDYVEKQGKLIIGELIFKKNIEENQNKYYIYLYDNYKTEFEKISNSNDFQDEIKKIEKLTKVKLTTENKRIQKTKEIFSDEKSSEFDNSQIITNPGKSQNNDFETNIISNLFSDNKSEFQKIINQNQKTFSLELFSFDLIYSIVIHYFVFNNFQNWSEKLISKIKFQNKFTNLENVLNFIIKFLHAKYLDSFNNRILDFLNDNFKSSENYIFIHQNTLQTLFSVIYKDRFNDFINLKNKILMLLKQNTNLNEIVLLNQLNYVFLSQSKKIVEIINEISTKEIDFEYINRNINLNFVQNFDENQIINEFLKTGNINNVTDIEEFNVIFKNYITKKQYINEKDFFILVASETTIFHLNKLSTENQIIIIKHYYTDFYSQINSLWKNLFSLISESGLKEIPNKIIEQLFIKITIQSFSKSKKAYFNFFFKQIEQYIPDFMNEIFSVLKKNKPEKFSGFFKILKGELPVFTKYLEFNLKEYKTSFLISELENIHEQILIKEIFENTNFNSFITNELFIFFKTGNFNQNKLLKSKQKTENIVFATVEKTNNYLSLFNKEVAEKIKLTITEDFFKILLENKNLFLNNLIQQRLLKTFSEKFILLIIRNLISDKQFEYYSNSISLFEAISKKLKLKLEIRKIKILFIKYLISNIFFDETEFFDFIFYILNSQLKIDFQKINIPSLDKTNLSENFIENLIHSFDKIISHKNFKSKTSEIEENQNVLSNEKNEFAVTLNETVQQKNKEFIDEFMTDDKRDIYRKIIEEKFDWLDNKKDGAKIYIENAGLVLLWVFLPNLFTRLKMIEKQGNKNQFVNQQMQERAVLLSQYLFNGKSEFPENELVLNKILCGFPIENTVPLQLEITDEEKKECEILLKSAIKHWSILGNTSIDGLRQSFLKRNGILVYKSKSWNLKVEQKAIDVLVKKLPWTFQTIKLSWNPYFIFVDWNA